MKNDITRDSFDPTKHFRRVLTQQGRVQLDSDINEQNSILFRNVETLAVDLLGQHGGPEDECGFGVTLRAGETDFHIGAGRYYADGLLCENDETILYTGQRDPEPLAEDVTYLVYLEAWERHLNLVEGDITPEEAIQRADTSRPVDTATRSEVVWKVRVHDLDKAQVDADAQRLAQQLKDALGEEAWTSPTDVPKELIDKVFMGRHGEQGRMCILQDPEYQDAENDLYRVEVHESGAAEPQGLSYKWARRNASSIFPIVSLAASTVTVKYIGEDGEPTLQKDDWVEVADRVTETRETPAPLLKVKEVEGLTVILDADGANLPAYEEGSDERPFLRRWDSGPVSVKAPNKPSPLASGLEVKFESGHYNTGDYWLIPVRWGAAKVMRGEWKPPDGISRHYAPLAVVSLRGGNVLDCRHQFKFRELQRRVRSLEGKVVSLDRRVSNLNSSVGSLHRRVGVLDHRVGVLERWRILQAVLLVFQIATILVLIVVIVKLFMP